MMRTDRTQKRERRLAEYREGPASPCISVCQIDPKTDLCIGCLRTISEIREWMISTPEQKLAILKKIEGRRES